MRTKTRIMRGFMAAAGVVLFTAIVLAASSQDAGRTNALGQGYALIVVGLPGDEDHETAFAATALAWRSWLTESLGFSKDRVQVLFGKAGRAGLTSKPASAHELSRTVERIKSELREKDRFWLFCLGHADHDTENAYFHLAGGDMTEDQIGKTLAGIRCREQVYWITTPASGWFVKPLSGKGRIIITATLADDELNETEFPLAMRDVISRRPRELDSDKDGAVSVLELYLAVTKDVFRRFESDKRVPTEHAMLDDNGDGKGTEVPSASPPGHAKAPTDGNLAARTLLPWK